MNSPTTRWSVAALLVVLLAGCAKKPDATPASDKPTSVVLVPDAERSRHFEAVSSHLELGGELYGYVDVDGDVLALAGSVQAIVKQAAMVQPQMSMFAKQDFKALMSDLGLTDVKAVGLSSVRESTGMYRNRAFLYTPEGRHGLFAVFGGPPGAFLGAGLAPSDVDLFTENEFDVVAVYDTVKAVIAKVNGPEAADDFEKAVKKAGSQAHFSLLDLIEGLHGTATAVLRLDPQKNVTIPGPKPFMIPAFSALIRIDGIGPALEASLAARPAQLEATQEGPLHLYTSKAAPLIEGLKYVFAVDGKAFYAATSAEFLRECLKRSDGLDTNPAFIAALASLGPQGNGVTWVSPRFFSRIKDLSSINPQATPEVRRFLDLYSASMPTASQPLLSVRANLPDGILIRSTWNRSLKADLAILTVYNPVTVGLMAAMAIPAFQKVRTNSQSMAVLNNLRQLSAAADQYYLEKGVATATYDDLVGPDKYIKTLVPVDGEDYHALVFAQGRRLRVRLADGRVISYPNDPNPYNQVPQAAGTADAYKRIAVVNNLRILEMAANQYYAANGVTSTTYDQLMAVTPHPEVTPVLGEDYKSVVFEKGIPLRIRLPDGRIIRDPNAVLKSRPAPEAAPTPDKSQAPASGNDAILQNLRLLDQAANQYYAAHDTTTVTFEQLVGPGTLLPQINSVQGEDYHSVLFLKGRPLRLYLKDGRVIVYPPAP